MAYITSKEAAEIKKDLRKKFRGFKFSVKKSHKSKVVITIVKAPLLSEETMQKIIGKIESVAHGREVFPDYGIEVKRPKN